MSISKTTCNHWHPDEPSEIRSVARADRKGGVGEVCATCNRARQKAKYWNKNAPNAPGRQTQVVTALADYGCFPRLNWPAPEFLKL